MGHNYVGTEHLLLGVLVDPAAISVRVLAELGIPVDRLRQAVVEATARIRRTARSPPTCPSRRGRGGCWTSRGVNRSGSVTTTSGPSICSWRSWPSRMASAARAPRARRRCRPRPSRSRPRAYRLCRERRAQLSVGSSTPRPTPRANRAADVAERARRHCASRSRRPDRPARTRPLPCRVSRRMPYALPHGSGAVGRAAQLVLDGARHEETGLRANVPDEKYVHKQPSSPLPARSARNSAAPN